MIAYEQVAVLADQLSLPEKAQLLEHLSTSLKRDLEVEAFKRMPYDQFIALTYGMFADEMLERDQPQHADVRDEVE
jgi:hypothetical protein